jgi:hypothetical protein
MQVRKPPKLRQVYFSLEDEYIERLKRLMTHHGQQIHEMRVAVIERIEKLERQQEDKELKAS